ncbi:MAG: enoyl-CoA hydratase/isomerase family protein [Hyphomicrobiaceae bacterium]
MDATKVSGQGCIVCERIGAIGRVTVDPASGLAETSDWLRWREAYDRWIADPNVYGGLIRMGPSAGSTGLRDIEAWLGRLRKSPDAAIPELAEFYRLIWTIDRFSKPTVAMLDGEVNWLDFCLVRHGTHKVVGEDFRLNLACMASWFPDAGATWWLSRLPGSEGQPIAAHSLIIDGVEALRLGLATHRIARDLFDGIERAYAEADPIDQVLDGLAVAASGSVSSRMSAAGAQAAVSPAVDGMVALLFAEARESTLRETLERDFAVALAMAGQREPFPTGLAADRYRALLSRAKSELALKPPPAVPEALG